MSLTRWFKAADASMTSESDEGALKEVEIAVEEVERQRLELEKWASREVWA